MLIDMEEEWKITLQKLSSKTIVYDKKLNIGYARVSTQKQKNNLIKQSQVLRDYANANGIILDKIYTEVASGMNENREELNKNNKISIR